MLGRFLLWLAPLLLLVALALVYLAFYAAPRAALTPFSAPRAAHQTASPAVHRSGAVEKSAGFVDMADARLGAPNRDPESLSVGWWGPEPVRPSGESVGAPLAFSKPPDVEEAPAVSDVASMGGSRLQAGGVGVPSPTSSAALSCSSPCHVDVSRPDGENPWHRAVASSYGWNDGYMGGPLACGGHLTWTALVVAHRTLPCGTKVEFQFRGHRVIAVVRDRGPYVAGRVWDLAPAVSKAIHFNGLSVVEWRFVP